MIVLRVCACGRSHDAIAWAMLGAIARHVAHGEEWQRRRCACGAALGVSVLEDDAAKEIESARRESSAYYARAGLELAMLRYARAAKLPIRWEQFRAHRTEARAKRALAKQVEEILASLYRARELRAPLKRIGRNLAVIEGGRKEARAARRT